MEEYSPTTLFLAEIKQRLAPLGIPVFFSTKELENYERDLGEHLDEVIVIGTYTSVERNAQSGHLMEDISQMVDIYLPIGDRAHAEEVKFKARKLLGRQVTNNAEITVDDSLGREIYRIFMRVSKTLI